MADVDFHDEVEIEDFEYDADTELFTHPCPCGDLFTIAKEDLLRGEEVARCPTCSLTVKVIFDPDDLERLFEKMRQARVALAIA